MITLEPYMYEIESYHLVPQADRWIFNKLIVAERLGHNCGPIGTKPAVQTDVVVRPCMNLSGMGRGGFFEYGAWPFAAQANVPNANPGYFWCERFTGQHTYTSYVDDVARFNASAPGVLQFDPTQEWIMVEDSALVDVPVLPAFLQGISKYLYVEAIGGNIIEVAPRHSGMSARQTIIDEYKQIDPTYAPTDIEFGAYDMVMRPDLAGGFRWEPKPNSRRPFVSEP